MSLLHRLELLGLDPLIDEPLARHVHWRIGGPADALVTAPDTATLNALVALGEPITVLGRGSNLLIADAGVRGVCVRLGGSLRQAVFGEDEHGPWVDAGAGLSNAALLRQLARRDLTGLGCLAGVPGTVGGAVRMNAGTRLGQLGAALIHADVLTPQGTRRLDHVVMSYRHAALPAHAIVLRARLRLGRDPDEPARIRAHLARRRATQPLSLPSCGSVFKNPPGDHAGRLIEAAGLKGRRQGGAVISERHANFIVNTGGATAQDVYALLITIRHEVQRRFQVSLDPEVHPIGDWPPGAWPIPDAF